MSEQAGDKSDDDRDGSGTSDGKSADDHDAKADQGKAGKKDREVDESAKDDEPKKESALKRPWVRFLLVLLAIAVVVALILYFVHYESRGKYLQSTNDAIVDANIVTVAPQVNGYVMRVFVEDDQDVKTGQPLVQIDARDYDAQVAQYDAQVEVSNANADNYRAQIRAQEATVAQNRQQYLADAANARFQASEAARYTPLAATGAETKEKAAQYQSQAQSAAHTAAADLAAVANAERQIGALEAQVRQALAQAKSAQAQADAAKVNVGLTLLRASAEGRIGDRSVRAGQFVQSGTKLMSLVPLTDIYVTANFKETQVGIMRPGQPATITVDALPGVKLDGHVVSASPGTGAQFSLIPPQNATGNFTKIVQRVPVRIAIDAGPEARKVLVPGLSVTVEVDTIGARESMARIRDQEKQRRDRGEGARDPRAPQVEQRAP